MKMPRTRAVWGLLHRNQLAFIMEAALRGILLTCAYLKWRLCPGGAYLPEGVGGVWVASCMIGRGGAVCPEGIWWGCGSQSGDCHCMGARAMGVRRGIGLKSYQVASRKDFQGAAFP